MPPPTRYTKESVLSTAFDLVRGKGLGGLTVRHVAKKLGSSTAPVYSAFGSMDELEREVVSRAHRQLLEHTSRSYTEMVFLNMGVGICVFAREEPWLFRALFLEGVHIKDNIKKLLDTLVKEMRRDPGLAEMPRKARMTLLTKMWTYTHGLAIMICLGVAEDSGDEFIIQSLSSVGRVVIEAALGERASTQSGGKPSPAPEN
ncbi:MAG: TetR family transcriptional regulator [bacterium]